MSNDDSFTLVKGRKGNKRQSLINFKTNDKQLNIVEYDQPIQTLISQIRDAVLEFKSSPYKTVLFDGLSEALDRLQVDKLDQIICYGLGPFSLNKNSKHQLAALLALKSHHNCQVQIYDPLFNKSELEALEILKLKIIQGNEEGKRAVENKVTLLFAIHCPKQIVNNFLYANWNEGIHNCIILGNSFSEVVNNSVDRVLIESAHFLTTIYPYTEEIKLNNTFEHFESFSSTSLHFFTRAKLSCLSSDFWSFKNEPVYQDQDVEFVRRESTKDH